jgi:hypothetical protein
MLALAKHANFIGEATVKVAELARLCRCSEGNIKILFEDTSRL